MDSLAGSTALVTGAAKRLGRAVALALAEAGANVVIHYGESRGEAEETGAAARQRGVRAWTVRADLADPAEAERLFAAAESAAGPVDAVINSASIFPPSTLRDMTAEDLARNMQVNAVAPFAIGRALAGTGRRGSIVNFLDSAMVHYDAAHAAYHVSKRTAYTLTRMMALEFAPAIRVNAVAPGLILPPPGEDDSFLERMASKNPLGRYGSSAGVAEAVLFLLRSDFITGQTIFVDGGYHLKGSVYGSG